SSARESWSPILSLSSAASTSTLRKSIGKLESRVHHATLYRPADTRRLFYGDAQRDCLCRRHGSRRIYRTLRFRCTAGGSDKLARAACMGQNAVPCRPQSGWTPGDFSVGRGRAEKFVQG